MSTAHFPQSTDDALTAIDAALVQEAGRIGSDIHRDTLHTSCWIDLFRQTEFPDQMGYELRTMIYDRAIPTTDAAGNLQGTTWSNMAIQEAISTVDQSVVTGTQPLAGATKQHAGSYGGDPANPAANLDNDARSYLNFSKKLKPYHLRKAQITAPKLNLEDLRFAAHRADQIGAQMDLMAEATRYTWEERHRDEYERVSANFVPCLATGTKSLTVVDADGDGTADDLFEGVNLNNGTFDVTTSGAANSDVTPDAMISNKVLDTVYNQLNRRGAGQKAYGRENGRPVYCLVSSSEASYYLQTEAGFRDDTRYNSAKVSDLIAPLGVEKSFRGFYHLNDDISPRYNVADGVLERVYPYVTAAGILADNPDYDTAEFEVAYIMHSEVAEAQIPNPFSGSNGITFDPQDYKGVFKWYNIQSESNPDKTTGFFRGVLASATKPIKTHFGYALLYKRTSSIPAA